jgi:hypothetical protein
MHEVLEGTGCDLLVASLRDPSVIGELPRRGIRRFNAASTVLNALFTDPASEAAIVNFEMLTVNGRSRSFARLLRHPLAFTHSSHGSFERLFAVNSSYLCSNRRRGTY